ncbi:MAG TPA: ribbon-helix-helix protein, CopG family [Ignavibacteria bacterium]|nr:ribbon-helix-helix protein, CopG family [Ignavibacteria bacterium]
MPNITLSMDEKLIEKSRKYAEKQGKSLNALIRELLQKTVNTGNTTKNTNRLFDLMDKAAGNSKGKKWSREEIYDRKVLR